MNPYQQQQSARPPGQPQPPQNYYPVPPVLPPQLANAQPPAQPQPQASTSSHIGNLSLQPPPAGLDDSSLPPANKKPASGKAKKKVSLGGRDKNDGDGGEGVKARKTRSRAACLGCKSTKQRCDGPSRIPCRRCELYGMECKFPPSTTIPPGAMNSDDTPAAGPSSLTTPAAGGADPVMTQKLFEIASRLQSIESALHLSRRHDASTASQSVSHDAQSIGSDDDMDHDGGSVEDITKTSRNNPMEMIKESIDAVVGQGFTPGGTRVQASGEDWGMPDIVARNMLTMKECQELFDFFFQSIHPWVMMLSLDVDRDAVTVRNRSSLLFHTILLLSTSYSNPFPSHLHATLITFLNAILAPQILNPQPHELTTDFLRAIDLLNLYKPTQLAARRSEGKDEAEAMRSSKVNGMASWMLQGILGRTAERLELKETVGKFAKAYSNSKTGAEISQELLRDLRLYYWLLSNDVHGNVQSGRRCNMEGAAALTTTRLFSQLQLQPYDVRLAASVEMFEVARPILRSFSYERTRKIPKGDLERFNQGMAAWDEYWVPILQRQLGVDPLAMTVLCPFQWFINLTYNASAYLSWRNDKMYSSDSGDNNSVNSDKGKKKIEGERGLSQWEFDGLEKCVRAAESLVFTLCEESRVKGGWRKVQWEEAERSDGWRKLALDHNIVEQSSWGMDAITCVAYIFPLVFLAKLVNDGILTVDLVLLRTPAQQPPWMYPRKLPRLLELGAAFLDAVALNPHHPAKAQAQVVRSLLDAGIRGLSPSPQLPRHAMTVLSPQVAATQLYPDEMSPNTQQQWQASGAAPIAADNNAMLQYQQQQQRAIQQQMQQQHLSQLQAAGVRVPVDQSLSAVLDGFDPSLFGDSTAFWEWGGLPGGTEMDWGNIGR
ncbi:C6 transcription factor [Pseudohyphozyma bogoriensis]|nr:C6 transcription factor [Pseudohyphozyma bogoriensis]